MKFLVALVVLFGLAVASDQNSCRSSVIDACKATSQDESVKCNALMGGFENVKQELQAYVNTQLATSYNYLLLGAHFNSYQKNRPGFHKLFQGLSDKAWDKAVELIKHITKRGGETDFNRRHENPSTISFTNNKVLEVDEMFALSMALDTEKKLAGVAHHIHRKSSHLDNRNHYDPEITQFIEEEFLEYQTDAIRKISGYANDLSKLVKEPNPALNVYLFDEYLAKQ